MEIKNNTFINALTIKEKYTVLNSQCTNYEINLDSLEHFRSMRNILTNTQFTNMLGYFGYDTAVFSHAVSQDITFNTLYEKHLEESDWYNEYLNTLSIIKPEEKYNRDKNLYYYISNFSQYLTVELLDILEHYSDYVFSKDLLLQSILKQINEKIMFIAHKSLILELNIAREKMQLVSDSSEERFHEFCKKAMSVNQIESFYTKYPVLCRLITNTVTNSINNISVFFERFVIEEKFINALLLNKTKPKIKDISLGSGDSHQKGQSVFILVLDSDEQIVYKPKNLKIVEFYNETLNIINSKVEKDNMLLSFKTTKGIYRDKYAFEEFVKQTPCKSKEEVRNYYRRFGQLLCLMYYFSGKDLHMENIIAHKEYPVVVDLETILQKNQEISGEGTPLLKNMLKTFSDNVLYSGLLPNPMTHFKIDLSALSGGKKKELVIAPGITNEGLDTMRIQDQEIEISKSNNLVKLDTEEIDFQKYNEEIIKGFDIFYDFLLNNNNIVPFNLLKAQELRILLRNTQNYSSLLEISYHPMYMSNSLYRENVLMNLFQNEFEDTISVAEFDDLLFGDIPIFFNKVNSRDLHSSDGSICAKNFFPEETPDFFNRSSLSTKDKEFQKALIMTKLFDNGILSNDFITPIKTSKITNKKINLIEEAKEIGNWIMDKSFSNNTEASFFTFTYNENRVFPSIIDSSLYNGLSGVMLFFIYLHKLSGDKKYYDFYKKILFTLENNTYNNSLDIFNGNTGLLYVYYRLYSEYRDVAALHKIDELTEKIQDLLVEKKFNNDWVGGIASIANVYLNLFNITNNSTYLQISVLCLEKIKAQKEDTILGGFSHGYSSLAALFVRAGYILSNSVYISDGKKFIEQDNLLFDNTLQAWTDNRKETPNDCLAHWCHGSVGIGLSRLEIQKNYNTFDIKTDIQKAKNHVLQSNPLNDDALCHGNMGRTEIFLSSNDYDTAIALATTIIDKKKINGFYNINNVNDFTLVDYGLFTGISGIGYQLLRIHSSAEVPNILILE